MSRAFIAEVIRASAGTTQTVARGTANDLIDALTKELKENGKFTLPSFGTFTVRPTKSRVGVNPKTGEKIKVAPGYTVRFKASKLLKAAV